MKVKHRRKLKLTVAYDGTNYHGFQRQDNAPSVQRTLEDKLAPLFGHPIIVAGSARTDSGVHAYGQVLTFGADGSIPVEKIVPASRGVLPDDIAVLSAEEVPEEFHARFSATGKRYLYKIYNHESRNPMLRNYAWQIDRPISVELINEAAAFLIGEHDFSAFRAAGGTAKSPVRTIHRFDCRRRDEMIELECYGNGFLYHMVRNIVGTLVDVGLERISPEEFQKIFLGRDRSRAGITAPAQGLYLMQVYYAFSP